MSEALGDDSRFSRSRRNLILLAVFGLLASLATSATAGPIRPGLNAKAVLQKTSGNQWGPYWQAALKYHWLNVHGPKAESMLRISSDGKLDRSPFVEYLLWRQNLNVKRFNSFHADLVKMLRRVRPGDIPPTPIDPPGFTPNEPQVVNPPQVPEPATGVIALMMIGAAIVARRRQLSAA